MPTRDPAAEAKKRADEADQMKKARAEADAKKAQAEAEAAKRAAAAKKKAAEAAEKAALEKARAEQEKAAQDKAAQEAAVAEKKAQDEREAESAKWRAKLANMQSSALLTASLDKELASELEEVRKKLEAGKGTVEAIDKEIVEVEAESVAAREAKAQRIRELGETVGALSAVRSVVAEYDASVRSLVSAAKEAHTELEQKGLDAQGVTSRLQRERASAQQRFDGAAEHKASLEASLATLAAELKPQEAHATEELQRLTAAAIAAKLQAQMGARRSDALVAEEARLVNMEGEVARHTAKLARAAAAKTEAAAAAAAVASDAAEEMKLVGEEKRVEAEASRAA